jgi:hypothetical protein
MKLDNVSERFHILELTNKKQEAELEKLTLEYNSANLTSEKQRNEALSYEE